MKRIILTIANFLIIGFMFAQTPEKISYQAVIRNSSNNLVTNQQISMQITILKGSPNGIIVYTETENPFTNANGLVSIEIGAETGFNLIDWSDGPYYLKTETDPSGGTNYSITAVSQLLSVPYALHAKTAETLSTVVTEADPVFTSSQAANITSGDISKLSNLSGTNTGDQDLSGLATITAITLGLESKVDKVAGKGLSTEDFTSVEKIKLASIDSSAEVNVQADWAQTLPSADDFIKNKPALATVAVSGSYNDLDSKPSLGSVLSTGENAGGLPMVNIGKVGIGTATPVASAALEVSSTNAGVLLPRMSTANRELISGPVAGLIIYNTTDNCINYYNGTNWASLTGIPQVPGGSATFPGVSCKQILINNPASASGIYWVDPDGAGGSAAFQCYCDMTTSGGGWTLVANNASVTTAPVPNWAMATGPAITLNGTLGLGTGDLWMGLSTWTVLGTELMYQVGNSPGVPVNSAKYNFTIVPGSNYKLNLSNQQLLTGTTTPGLFTIHNGSFFSASDRDNDNSTGSCSANNGNTPWWYNNCWIGSIWGSGGTNGAHWDTGGGAGFAWGAIWVR